MQTVDFERGRALVFSDRLFADLPEQKITFMPLYSAYTASRGRETPDDAAKGAAG